MKLVKLLSPEQIIADLEADEHRGAIAELVDRLVTCGLLAVGVRDATLEALREREQLVSTGIGGYHRVGGQACVESLKNLTGSPFRCCGKGALQGRTRLRKLAVRPVRLLLQSVPELGKRRFDRRPKGHIDPVHAMGSQYRTDLDDCCIIGPGRAPAGSHFDRIVPGQDDAVRLFYERQ